MSKSIPAIVNDRGIPTLYVNGEPFFALGGELHNSSASSEEYMNEKVWPYLKGLNMNTVVATVYWELIEAEEGKFDFSSVDSLILGARENGMKLVILWFGLWKNSESMYVPGWMKRDRKKYFMVRKASGDTVNVISPLCEAAVEKDAAAFRQLMRHIREIDSEETTVITMQIENEIGVLGSGCDYGETAKAAFAGEIPEVLKTKLGKTGTWREAFGEDAEEKFLAYYYASAVEKIAAAGREEYPLPCYANVWLRQYPWYTGSYPTGGPVREVHDIWKAAAPSLFAIGPDIYVPYAPYVMDEYHYEGNPLFIPEIRKDAAAASYCLYAFGKHDAMCFSPFGIEDLLAPPDDSSRPDPALLASLNIDPSAFDTTGTEVYLAGAYDFMSRIKPLYLKYRGTEHMKTYLRMSATDSGSYFKFAKYDILVQYYKPQPKKPVSAGMIFELADNKFLVCGMMSRLTFRAKEGTPSNVTFERIEEGVIENGEWKRGRVLNGDERMFGHGERISCFMVTICDY